MSPDEFWSLTPSEIYELVKGYNQREKNEMHKLAWHAANVMNVHLKKKVTAKKLLGKEKQPMTTAQMEAELAKLNKVLGERRGSDDANRRNIS